MKQNLGRLVRYILVINRLSGLQKYVPADELIHYLNKKMRERGYDTYIGLRTLQRDFKEIYDLFSIEIKHRRGFGYFIAYENENPDIRYNEILVDFDLITSINPETKSLGFILPEHHRPKGSDSFPLFISAIKENRKISFDYTLYRHENAVRHRTICPYFLKESLGFWYLIGTDDAGKLRYYGIDRINNVKILAERFEKDLSIDPEKLFKHSYGIWDDPEMPVEHIELSYSPLDGSFIKARPMHWSQQTLIDDEKEFRISLEVRITNDFIMELLSRSKSLEVIKPESLRETIRNISEQCYKRNS